MPARPRDPPHGSCNQQPPRATPQQRVLHDVSGGGLKAGACRCRGRGGGDRRGQVGCHCGSGRVSSSCAPINHLTSVLPFLALHPSGAVAKAAGTEPPRGGPSSMQVVSGVTVRCVDSRALTLSPHPLRTYPVADPLLSLGRRTGQRPSGHRSPLPPSPTLGPPSWCAVLACHSWGEGAPPQPHCVGRWCSSWHPLASQLREGVPARLGVLLGRGQASRFPVPCLPQESGIQGVDATKFVSPCKRRGAGGGVWRRRRTTTGSRE